MAIAIDVALFPPDEIMDKAIKMNAIVIFFICIKFGFSRSDGTCLTFYVYETINFSVFASKKQYVSVS